MTLNMIKANLSEGLTDHLSACNNIPRFSVVNQLCMSNLLMTCEVMHQLSMNFSLGRQSSAILFNPLIMDRQLWIQAFEIDSFFFLTTQITDYKTYLLSN